MDCAKEGGETLKLYRKSFARGKPYDVVILDLTIPGGMSGKDTMKRLFKFDPNVKAIVSSGYSNDPIIAEFKKYKFKGCIIKPYKIEELPKVLLKVIRS